MNDRERYTNLEGWISFGLVMSGLGMSVKRVMTPFLEMGTKKLKDATSVSEQETWQTFVDTLKEIEKA